MARIGGSMIASGIYPVPGFSDPVSSLTHLLGAGAFGVLGLVLIRRGRGDLGRIAVLGVFSVSCVLLLSLSGTYHLLSPNTTARSVLRRLDHGAIFALIAGTFTPVLGILFTGPARWGMLLVIWSLAATGISLKTIFFSAVPEWVSVTLFIAMGWTGIVPTVVLWRRYGTSFVRPLVAGAGFYTLGAVLEFAGWPTLLAGVVGPHEVFHLAVLAGMACHWRFVSQFATGEVLPPVGALPASPRRREPEPRSRSAEPRRPAPANASRP
jgi:channel protein (hemolysin III family)